MDKERKLLMYENQKHNEEVEVDLSRIFRHLLHKVGYIILFGLLCAVVAFTYYKHGVNREYTSTTQIYVIDKESSENMTSTDVAMYSALSNDYIQLIKTRPVLEQVIAELKLDIKSEELKNQISAVKEGDSRIISINVVDESPIMAKRIADAVASAAAKQIYNVMDAELVNVVQPGNVPETPTSPGVLKVTMLAGIIGMFITMVIILVIYFLDDTIVVEEDVERYLGISVIGIIPEYGMEAVHNVSKRTKKITNPLKAINKPDFSKVKLPSIENPLKNVNFKKPRVVSTKVLKDNLINTSNGNEIEDVKRQYSTAEGVDIVTEENATIHNREDRRTEKSYERRMNSRTDNRYDSASNRGSNRSTVSMRLDELLNSLTNESYGDSKYGQDED